MLGAQLPGRPSGRAQRAARPHIPAARLRSLRENAWPGNNPPADGPRVLGSPAVCRAPTSATREQGAKARAKREKKKKNPPDQSGALFILKLRPQPRRTPPSLRVPASRRQPRPAPAGASQSRRSSPPTPPPPPEPGTRPRVAGRPGLRPRHRRPGALPRCGGRPSPAQRCLPEWVRPAQMACVSF